MLKNFRQILHFILYLEVSLLLLILYVFIIIPMSFVRKTGNKEPEDEKSYWVDFKEKYQTIADLKKEG